MQKMAKVTNKELNECIAEAIAEVIKEDWADDVVRNAMRDTSAKNAFLRDKKKDDKIEMADDEKIASSEVADLPDADDEETVSFGKDFNVYDMSYDELKNAVKNSNPGTNLRTAATKELKLRNEILRDKKDILNGELIMPYGWEFDENGYPVRKHSFMQEAAVSWADIDNMVNTAMKDKKAQKAFGLKTKKGKNGEEDVVSDEDILDVAAEKEKADAEEDEKLAKERNKEEEQDLDKDEKEEKEFNELMKTPAGQRVLSMSYEELNDTIKNITGDNKNKAISRAAKREKATRDSIMSDLCMQINTTQEFEKNVNKLSPEQKMQIFMPYLKSKQISLPYGWKIGDNGELERTHLFNTTFNDTVNIANSNGTNFHWLRPNMDVRGNEIGDRAGQGTPDANWT